MATSGFAVAVAVSNTEAHGYHA